MYKLEKIIFSVWSPKTDEQVGPASPAALKENLKICKAYFHSSGFFVQVFIYA